jgi:hypothetical protein
MVYGETGTGHRFLDSILQRDHSRKTAHPETLGSLSLGIPSLAPTMTYWRKLLTQRMLSNVGGTVATVALAST